MEKVVNGSEEYLEKESTRCVPFRPTIDSQNPLLMEYLLCSLATILQKRTLAPGKLDEIKIKANILGAFRPIVAKVEEVVEEAKEDIKRDAAEL